MQKVNMSEAREVSGGRWKCGNCSQKTLTVAAMHLHLAAAHNAYNIAGYKTANWRYSWCL